MFFRTNCITTGKKLLSKLWVKAEILSERLKGDYKLFLLAYLQCYLTVIEIVIKITLLSGGCAIYP